MVVELINTGSELMLGRVLNTHQQWLCRQLADLGYVVSRQIAIADTAEDIEATVRESLSRADIIITTGGLGPTSDDLTRDLIARLLGRKLSEDPVILARLQEFFASRKRPMPESTRVQAQVPEGALILPNAHGTAPGLAIELSPNPYRENRRASWLIMLPGPPRELRPMFTGAVAPLLARIAPVATAYHCRILRTVGIGESVLAEQIAPALGTLVTQGLDLGYCARLGQVDIRLAAQSASAAAMVASAERLVFERAGEHIFGTGDEELEAVIIRLLAERKQTLALAESCTGGGLANRLTNVPGASAVLLASVVSYSNAAKQQFLGVKAETLEEHGAVSKPVAREMAEGVRSRTGADYAISITGIAGPGGGSAEKPVGTVFIGLAGPNGTVVLRNLNAYDRETFKQVTCLQAMEMLRRTLLR